VLPLRLVSASCLLGLVVAACGGGGQGDLGAPFTATDLGPFCDRMCNRVAACAPTQADQCRTECPQYAAIEGYVRLYETELYLECLEATSCDQVPSAAKTGGACWKKAESELTPTRAIASMCATVVAHQDDCGKQDPPYTLDKCESDWKTVSNPAAQKAQACFDLTDCALRNLCYQAALGG
jgi:hypothetical protein